MSPSCTQWCRYCCLNLTLEYLSHFDNILPYFQVVFELFEGHFFFPRRRLWLKQPCYNLGTCLVKMFPSFTPSTMSSTKSMSAVVNLLPVKQWYLSGRSREDPGCFRYWGYFLYYLHTDETRDMSPEYVASSFFAVLCEGWNLELLN